MLTEKLEKDRLHIISLKQIVCLFGREGESKQDTCCMNGIKCLESSFSEILPASFGYCMSWLLICSRSIGMCSIMRFWAYKKLK